MKVKYDAEDPELLRIRYGPYTASYHIALGEACSFSPRFIDSPILVLGLMSSRRPINRDS